MKTGKNGISARIVAGSINQLNGTKLTTFEIEFPRWILAEVNTHKMLSKNTSSSRAIPFKKYFQKAWNDPATPIYWGKNQAGMTAKEEVYSPRLTNFIWRSSAKVSSLAAWLLNRAGLHKQTCNRILENYTMVKMVISGTEWNNFFYLRNHKDAQPEFQELARLMQESYEEYDEWVTLSPGEWHLPYVETKRNKWNKLEYFDSNDDIIDVETARKISASCCAQVSYRLMNDSLEKALDIFSRLIESKPCHASPLEHQGTPISKGSYAGNPLTWDAGVTHLRKDGSLWSANFRWFVQFRQITEGHTVW